MFCTFYILYLKLLLLYNFLNNLTKLRLILTLLLRYVALFTTTLKQTPEIPSPYCRSSCTFASLILCCNCCCQWHLYLIFRIWSMWRWPPYPSLTTKTDNRFWRLTLRAEPAQMCDCVISLYGLYLTTHWFSGGFLFKSISVSKIPRLFTML